MQKVAIAATHVVLAIGDQTPGLVLARIALPIRLAAMETEKRFGNFVL